MTNLIAKEVDGHNYEFQKFGAKKAVKILIRLSRILGEPLASMFGSAGEKGLDAKVDGAMLQAAVASLTMKLEEDEVLSLLETMTSEGVLCDGKKIVFDHHYQDQLDHMFKVFWAALEVQYGNFTAAILGARDFLQKGVMTPAKQT